jgi:hypothetical protein
MASADAAPSTEIASATVHRQAAELPAPSTLNSALCPTTLRIEAGSATPITPDKKFDTAWRSSSVFGGGCLLTSGFGSPPVTTETPVEDAVSVGVPVEPLEVAAAEAPDDPEPDPVADCDNAIAVGKGSFDVGVTDGAALDAAPLVPESLAVPAALEVPAGLTGEDDPSARALAAWRSTRATANRHTATTRTRRAGVTGLPCSTDSSAPE